MCLGYHQHLTPTVGYPSRWRVFLSRFGQLPGLFQLATWAEASLPLVKGRLGWIFDSPSKRSTQL